MTLRADQSEPGATESRPASDLAVPAWIDESAPPGIQKAKGEKPTTRRALWKWLGITVIVIVAGYAFKNRPQTHASRPLIVGPIAADKSGESRHRSQLTPAQASRIVVHVVGAVKRPGVYELPPNSRVRDALAKAGGARSGADVNALNLAAWLEDGQKIEVPPKPSPASSLSHPSAVQNSRGQPAIAAASRRTQPAKPNTLSRPTPKAALERLRARPLDLNRASREELELLPGIGPAIAGRIMVYREENGRFATVDELDEVKGIGFKKLEKIRPFITVR